MILKTAKNSRKGQIIFVNGWVFPAVYIFIFATSEIMRTFAPVFITCLTTIERSNYAIILQQSAKGKSARAERCVE